MKTITSKLKLAAIAGIALVTTFSINSCKKNSSSPATPTVTSITLTSGATVTAGTSTGFTITGTNLTGATVTATASGVTVSGIAVTGSTSITGTVAINASFMSGTVTLTITTSLGSTSATFTVVGLQVLGGYISSDSVAAANLIAYFPFNGNANDTIGGMMANVTGNVTYATGLRGQSYQGTAGAYATYTPSAAFSSLTSYSVSVWYKLPTSDPSYSSTTGQDTLTQGMFFLYGTDNWLLVNEIEPFHGDSVRVHPGFQDFASPAYQGFVPETFDTMAIGKWVNFVVTYNGGTSSYITYQDGVPTGANDAFTSGMYLTPNPLYTDGTMATPLGNIGWGTHTPSSVIVGSWPDGLFGQSAAVNTFRGQLDELRVYNKALSQAEVVGLYLNGQAGR